LKNHLMASYVRIVCAKNRENPSILLKVTIENVGVPFLRHSVDDTIVESIQRSD